MARKATVFTPDTPKRGPMSPSDSPHAKKGCLTLSSEIALFLFAALFLLVFFGSQLPPEDEPQATAQAASSDGRRVLAPHTAIPSPSPSPATRPANFVLDLPALIGLGLLDVNARLGEPELVTNMSPGTVKAFKGPSVARTYHYKNFALDALSDRAGHLRSLQVVGGLQEEGYRIGDWPKAFARFGLPSDLPDPDLDAPIRYVWNDVNGLVVEVMQWGAQTDSAIWSILVYLPPDAPLPARPALTPGPAATPTPRPAALTRTTPSRGSQATVLQPANLRSGPGTDYPVVGSRAAGESVDVVAADPAAEWLLLAEGAWIAAFLVEPVSGLPMATPAVALPTATPTPTNLPPISASDQAVLEAVDAHVKCTATSAKVVSQGAPLYLLGHSSLAI